MMGPITDTAERVYERLRKRSYRRWLRNDMQWQTFYDYDLPMPTDNWNELDHAAYVRGLREAVNAIEKEVTSA